VFFNDPDYSTQKLLLLKKRISAMRNHSSNSLSAAKRIILTFFFFLVLMAFTLEANPPEASDEHILSIVKRAKEGDDDSFATLFEMYYLPIWRHLYRMVGNEEDARDLAAEAFTRAWYRLPRIHEEKNFRQWLYKIATNVALDFLREKRAQKRGPQPAVSLSEDCANVHTARFEDQVEDQELIKLALEEVAPKPRACFLLYEEGLSQEEIAEIMGMRKKSIATYISIAREQFRKAYNRLKNL
jgi:RNA polymerase sigma-70 factor, ECF subfamily